MRTVTFQSVLCGSAKMLGLDPGRDMNPVKAAQLTEFINQHVKDGWEFDFWPEWTVVEQRAYRVTYDLTATYAALGEVYFPAADGYYQALRAVPAGQAPATGSPLTVNLAYWAPAAASYSADNWMANTVYALGAQVFDPTVQQFKQCYSPHTSGASLDNTKFGVLTAFNRYIAYEQIGRTKLGQVKALYYRSPRVYPRNPGRVPHSMSDVGVQIPAQVGATQMFVEFSARAPVFTSVSWNSATAYTGAGEAVYLGTSTGECYESILAGTNKNPVTEPTYWRKLDMPRVLSNYVKRKVVADGLRGLKQFDKATVQENLANAELRDSVDREIPMQGEYETAQVRTYGT